MLDRVVLSNVLYGIIVPMRFYLLVQKAVYLLQPYVINERLM